MQNPPYRHSRFRGNDGCFMASVMNYGKINRCAADRRISTDL